jgi:hypothetical protein
MNEVVLNHNELADTLCIHFYRWLSNSRSLLYDPALHQLVQTLMRKVSRPQASSLLRVLSPVLTGFLSARHGVQAPRFVHCVCELYEAHRCHTEEQSQRCGCLHGFYSAGHSVLPSLVCKPLTASQLSFYLQKTRSFCAA